MQKFDVPIEATTSNLEVLKNYSMSITIGRENGDAPSIPFLKRAIELDPNFPMAYAALSISYGNLGQRSLALEYATKAYELRDRVTEREKLRISADYFVATGELDKESPTYELQSSRSCRSKERTWSGPDALGQIESPHQMLGSRSKYSSSSFLPPSPLPSTFSDSMNSIRSIHLTIL